MLNSPCHRELFERRHVGLQLLYYTPIFSHLIVALSQAWRRLLCRMLFTLYTFVLDMSNLLFLSFVCGDCWNQLHGCPYTPRSSICTPSKHVLSHPISMLQCSSLFTSPISLPPTVDTILPPSLNADYIH